MGVSHRWRQIFRNAPRGFKETLGSGDHLVQPQLARKVRSDLVAWLEGNGLSVEVFCLRVQASRGNLFAVFCLHTCMKDPTLRGGPSTISVRQVRRSR